MADQEDLPPDEPPTNSVASVKAGKVTDSALNWLTASEEQVVQDDLSQLLSETRGVCEKLADAAVKMGAWQMVLWQPRWVYAEVDGLCYQKISTTEKPIGKPKKILYADVKQIEELDCAEFVLQTASRDYTFKAPNEDAATVLVHNLRQLRQLRVRPSGTGSDSV
eukprot:CAMPEP_0183350986 /NCGR_PEP_ID=MMETSP0164_2-20130417/22666_1 /TAXON_ID=221442 /ORGANISM="Coccolithus pelagicus ssp braarudi, Strain PLY182g" /LENGTH=164 /DNA_ID=CAMNT_0025523053 /DNA_START=69 /DNA_END=563 /DNA_ORIENTATION=+